MALVAIVALSFCSLLDYRMKVGPVRQRGSVVYTERKGQQESACMCRRAGSDGWYRIYTVNVGSQRDELM